MASEREPELLTDPDLAGVLAELVAREPIFHRPELGTSRSALEGMLAPGFWEVGASGRRYSAGYVLEVLEERYAKGEEDPWETRDFQCRRLAEQVFLLTYTLVQGVRETRRATLWQRTEAGWKIAYHQGTIVQP
jgi:hypothetical protein